VKKRLLALLLVAIPAFCAQRQGPISLRKRLHVNPLITDPDTVEFDTGVGGGPLTVPTAIRYTPEGSHIYWGRTEMSVSYDAAKFDRATFAATCVVQDGEKVDIAIAPLLAAPLRGGDGLHPGGAAIARLDIGRNSAGVTATWLTNTWDFGAGYGRKIGAKVTPHMNWQWEKAAGTPAGISVFEGVEYQFSDPFALDLTAQHMNVWGGQTNNQLVLSLTLSSPRLHRH
jgi:hypothetical protein